VPVLVPIESTFLLDGLVSCAGCELPMRPVLRDSRERWYTCRNGCERLTVEAGHAERSALRGALERLSTSDDAPYVPGWTPPPGDSKAAQAHVAQRWNSATPREQRELLDKLIYRVIVGLRDGEVMYDQGRNVPISVAFHRK
jgi:hypothetical protein